jgi:hypothetical protein
MEIFNKRYGNREDFRFFWDCVLMNTMPERPLWGFSNDDTHFVNETGFNFNLMLMPENTVDNIRYAMKNGTFYTVSLAAVNVYDPALKVPFPVINNIVVDRDENSITITGENYDDIQWVVGHEIIATGHKIDLNDYEDKIGNYIRAELKGAGGVSFTQPFGIIPKNHNQLGDINGDGRIDSTDWVSLLRHILNMDGYYLTGESLLAADVDGSGSLASMDLAYMKRYILGFITSFPASQKKAYIQGVILYLFHPLVITAAISY